MIKVMKRSFNVIFIFVVVILCNIVSCVQYSQLRLLKSNVESVQMEGLSTLNLLLNLEIDNPDAKLTVKDIRGKIYYKDELLADAIALEPLSIMPHSRQEYTLKLQLKLNKSMSIFNIIRSISNGGFKNEDCYIIYDIKLSPRFLPDYWIKNNKIGASDLLQNS